MTIQPIYSPLAAERSGPHQPLIIKVVETEEERLKAMLVRAIVYMHEQQCPYHEEFDLNDHSATQVVGLGTDGEPILTARLRYFSGFAKLERLAIRAEYRGRGYGHRLLSFLLSLGLQKGFARFYLHAQQRLQPFYEGHGFRLVGADFAFSDHDYVEMQLEMGAQSHRPAEHIGRQPMLLNRPENNLYRAGPLEWRSSVEASRHVSRDEAI